MEVFRRVKKYLTREEYAALDKNNRTTPEGEVVPVRTEDGRELPDPVPIAPPVGWHAQPSMFEQMRQMIRGEALRAYAEAQGDETFEEAQDFDVEDDDFPQSPYEGEYPDLEDLQARRQMNFRRRFIEEEENASYVDWRNKTLEEQASRGVMSPLHRQSASAPKARPAAPHPEPANGED